MLESDYQAYIIKELQEQHPGCIVLKNDPSYLQGIPDLTMFRGRFWATLEVKTSKNARERPNQRYYVELMNEMSFSSFIYPEIEQDVFDALQHAYESYRYSRVS